MLKERLTYREIARLCGVANGTVWSVLKDVNQECSNHPQLQFPGHVEDAAVAMEDVAAQIKIEQIQQFLAVDVQSGWRRMIDDRETVRAGIIQRTQNALAGCRT